MESQFTTETRERIARCGVIAVLVIDSADDAVPLAKALLAGGIDVMELTLRTEAAIPALKAIVNQVPEMLTGIGTILTPDQVKEVAAAGAAFGVAPGLNKRVVQQAQKLGLPFSPGILTPTDLEAAVELGCRELKFFPAEPAGGMKYLKSIAAPYAHLGVKFIPLGGLCAANIDTYLSDPSILAVGGSWIAKRDMINEKNWDQITKNAAEARQIIEKIQKEKRNVKQK
jgi:2-dehydro-3-deoxyphosphogluconate aldolase/(4S)-4-hydroxy-2-oxoglutarate aldolase